MPHVDVCALHNSRRGFEGFKHLMGVDLKILKKSSSLQDYPQDVYWGSFNPMLVCLLVCLFEHVYMGGC